MKKLYYYRDMLERNLNKNELQELLEHNGQEIPSGNDRVGLLIGDCLHYKSL